jgi:rhamnose transport system ATP-binding protein
MCVDGAAQPRLRLEGITKSFDSILAVNDVSFAVQPGEIHALVGENGAGKSTVINIVTGILQPDAGAIYLDGKRVRYPTSLAARASGVAAVYQESKLFSHLSVAENIFVGNYPTSRGRVDRRAMDSRAKSLLSEVGFPLDIDVPVTGLTVAEGKFIEIARALSTELRVLILDEPTSAFTPRETAKLYEIVTKLKATGTTIIWISHRMEEIHEIAGMVTVMRDGAHVRTVRSSEITDDEIVRLMVGRSVSIAHVPRDTPPGQVRLRVSGLSLAGPFEDITFEVRAGEILGVAGLAGAGRTEIAQAIFGVRPADSGSVEIDGKRVVPRSARHMSRLGVVYLPEDRERDGIIPSASVTRNIALPSTPALATYGVMRPRKERALAQAQKGALNITGDVDDLVSSLSGGNRQKVALGRWLATRPGILLLDEPTRGIDVGTKAQVHDIIRDLAWRQRLAVVVISSELPELLAISDRILVISRGHLVANIDAADATGQKVMAAAVGIVPKKAQDA